MNRIDQIAQAVLYEGYILWPYRRSAPKNQQRWTFGCVFPEAHTRERPDDACLMRAGCLVSANSDTRVEVRLRFLQVVDRRVARAGPAGQLRWVDELVAGGQRYLAWEEATEREVIVAWSGIASLLGRPHTEAILIPASTWEERVEDPDGGGDGVIVRSCDHLQGTLEVDAERAAPDLVKLTVTLRNLTPWQGGDRAEALRRSFVSTHTVLRVEGGEFLSMTDPPEEFRVAAKSCENVGAWPVLVGEEGERDTLLAAPIILPDYPRIAPESPGDLFDGTEIDQLLILNVLALTEQEKEEMRASDPRTREILDRCAALTPEQLARLHGAIRDFRPISTT